MSIAPLDLDFLRTRAGSRRTGTILLGIGVVLTLIVAGRYADFKEERARWEDKVSDTRKLARRALPGLSASEVPSAELQAELRRANAVLDQLSLRWDRLFEDVESAVDANVALLGLQPDARGRVVTVEGEARHLDGLLAFLSRLESTRSLERVHLVSHEIRGNNPQRPLAFKVLAQWVSTP